MLATMQAKERKRVITAVVRIVEGLAELVELGVKLAREETARKKKESVH